MAMVESGGSGQRPSLSSVSSVCVAGRCYSGHRVSGRSELPETMARLIGGDRLSSLSPARARVRTLALALVIHCDSFPLRNLTWIASLPTSVVEEQAARPYTLRQSAVGF